MTIDRSISYILHNFLENHYMKGSRRVGNLVSKILLPLPKNRVIIENRDGQKVILNPASDKGIEEAIFYTGRYEAGVVNILERFLREGDVFLEVGANIAPLSMSASKIIGQSGMAYAFEPDPVMIKMIERNCKLNAISNITPINIGLGEKKSNMQLYIKPDINRGASSFIKEKGDRSISVKVETLDSSLKKLNVEKVSMMVIDVEGWESQVLKGGHQTIMKFKPLISIELNSKYNPEKLYSILTSYPFYSIYMLRRSKEYVSKLVKVNSFDQLRTDDNIFCLTADQEQILERSIL